ncbi:hypothetical protein ACWCRF_18720 [Streptomyces sp. NPDC002405]|uniref:hypothetical protein n=1 Tax=unclassified Streptomyces TaxID=2593676 RepID=UPI0036BE7DCD
MAVVSAGAMAFGTPSTCGEAGGSAHFFAVEIIKGELEVFWHAHTHQVRVWLDEWPAVDA